MSRRRRDQGFTLIEVLVALAILAVSLAVLMVVISTSLDRAREDRNEMIATALAQSLLARVGTEVPLQAGRTQGSYTSGFRWRLLIGRFGNADDRKAWPVTAYAVRVTISWGGKGKELSLTTLKLAEQ